MEQAKYKKAFLLAGSLPIKKQLRQSYQDHANSAQACYDRSVAFLLWKCFYQPCLATPALIAASAFSSPNRVVSLLPLPSFP